MNYLAHAFLSPADPYELMGNLWGDLIRPKDYPVLSPAVLKGVAIHRSIDAFTDQHAGVGKINDLLRPFQGKYTPVVTDVLMDYILSKNWSRYCDDSLENFCEKKYSIVKNHLTHIPERLHPRINRMLQHHWLESCKDREHVEGALRMLSRRASFENHIMEALIAYGQHQQDIDQLFLVFFQDLQQYISLRNES